MDGIICSDCDPCFLHAAASQPMAAKQVVADELLQLSWSQNPPLILQLHLLGAT